MVERTGSTAEDKLLIVCGEPQPLDERRTIEQPLAPHRVTRAKDHMVGTKNLNGALELCGTPRLGMAHLKEDVVVQASCKGAVIGLETLNGVGAL